MKKIKVCHVVCGLRSGGVESMIFNYCSKLDNNKFEWYLLYQHEPTEKNLKEFKELGFKLLRITSKIKNPLKNYLETYEFFKKNKIDVVHSHMTLMNWIPLLAAKKLGIPIRISHSHNSDLRKKNIFVRLFENFCKKLNKNYATFFLACGEKAGQYLYGKDKFDIIQNALDVDKFLFNLSNRIKIREQYEIDDEQIVIGHIGRFVKQKNHEFIIQMFEKICQNYPNKYKLLLIGDGESKDRIKEYVTNSIIKNDVIFTGIVDNTNEFYSAFDCFILPSLWEGLPVVAIEAQISGVNCVLSKNIDNECKINENVLFVENTLDVWTDAIYNLKIERTSNLERLNAKGFNIDKELKKIEKIYTYEEGEK